MTIKDSAIPERLRENPFTPSFGESPDHLAGRGEIIAGIRRGLTAQARRPELTSLFYGARGTGKTTLLNVVVHLARQLGWVTASVTALPGMLDEIELLATQEADHLIASRTQKTKVTKVGIPDVFTLELDTGSAISTNWRSRMTALLDELEKHDTGLVITIDEVTPNLDELIQLAATYQHFVRENRRIALFMAGLPQAVSGLLNSKTVSFLRRAHMSNLGRIGDFEVRQALSQTIHDGGRTIDTDALDAAVKAISGFAYLVQLVGFRAWDIHPENDVITIDDMNIGIAQARAELESHVLLATYRELSPSDIKFLEAMLPDKTESKISDITRRLGWSSSQVAQYRRRLIDAGVIGERTRGVVGFDLPYFRDYVASRK